MLKRKYRNDNSHRSRIISIALILTNITLHTTDTDGNEATYTEAFFDNATAEVKDHKVVPMMTYVWR